MDNNNLQEIFTMLIDSTNQLAKKISDKRGFDTPYELVFKNLDTEKYADMDILVCAGNPPKIIISEAFALDCLINVKKIIYRDRLERALEKLPRMNRTLSNLIPISLAIALKKDARKWTRSLIPEMARKIAERYLEIDYSVTVKDIITGTEITLHGKNPAELKETAVLRVSKIVFETEDLDELHALLQAKLHQNQSEPTVIAIGGSVENTQTKVEY